LLLEEGVRPFVKCPVWPNIPVEPWIRISWSMSNGTVAFIKMSESDFEKIAVLLKYPELKGFTADKPKRLVGLV
jgi:hypothetical protein